MTHIHSSTAGDFPTTRIERVPGERPHTFEFDVYVDGSVIGTYATRAAAQEALDEYRYERLRRQPAPLPTRPMCGAELAALWAADRDAALRFLAALTPIQLGAQAMLHSRWLWQAHGKVVEPVEIVRRYQHALAMVLDEMTDAAGSAIPLQQAA
jgi:hypothetical protein